MANYCLNRSGIGNDATGTGTSANPWQTLSKGCSVAVSGDNIYIAVGIYNDGSRCNLARGVDIFGPGTVTSCVIKTTYQVGMGDGYIYRQDTPVVTGFNEITGFTIDGVNKTCICGIFLRGSDCNSIHDMNFINIMSNAIIYMPAYDAAVSNSSPPNTYGLSSFIYNINTSNTTTQNDLGWGARLGALFLQAMQGAKVYNINIDESMSGCGTGFKGVPGWFKSCEFYNTNVRTNLSNSDCFVFEMYNFEGDSQWHDSTFYHMFSLNGGPRTISSGYTRNLRIHHTSTILTSMPDNGLNGDEISHNYVQYDHNFHLGAGFGMGGLGLWSTNYLTALNVMEVLVNNNVFRNIGKGGIFPTRDIINLYVYNNTFDMVNNNPWGGYAVDTESLTSPLSGLYIKNNIMMSGAAGPINLHNTYVNHAVITNNFFYGNGNSNNMVGSGIDLTFTSNVKGVLPQLQYAGNIPSPWYNPTGITANVVDAGVDVGLGYVGAAPDIGAYEWLFQAITAQMPDRGVTRGVSDMLQWIYNTPLSGVYFPMVTASGTYATGFDVAQISTVISKDGGAFVGTTNGVQAIGNGVYKIGSLTATEMQCYTWFLRVTANSGCLDQAIIGFNLSGPAQKVDLSGLAHDVDCSGNNSILVAVSGLKNAVSGLPGILTAISAQKNDVSGLPGMLTAISAPKILASAFHSGATIFAVTNAMSSTAPTPVIDVSSIASQVWNSLLGTYTSSTTFGGNQSGLAHSIDCSGKNNILTAISGIPSAVASGWVGCSGIDKIFQNLSGLAHTSDISGVAHVSDLITVNLSSIAAQVWNSLQSVYTSSTTFGGLVIGLLSDVSNIPNAIRDMDIADATALTSGTIGHSMRLVKWATWGPMVIDKRYTPNRLYMQTDETNVSSYFNLSDSANATIKTRGA